MVWFLGFQGWLLGIHFHSFVSPTWVCFLGLSPWIFCLFKYLFLLRALCCKKAKCGRKIRTWARLYCGIFVPTVRELCFSILPILYT